MTSSSATIVYIDEGHIYCRASRAAQEMISDLYDGFFGYERNAQVALPEGHTICPSPYLGN
jgi:hypothetical protein